ncbi:hypothetical protein D1Z90_20570 [Motilimonas pumila]|uniref:DUF2384 domain-containing protein n=1 Tax=Motilimonas pumila TaxID=2303987 RepID=A0A418Y924_9GAMM|nr:hypothetical protein D1Z90_20570 [Motilimonas pumila]
MSNWDDFAQLCKPCFSDCTFKDELISECGGKEDLAWVVYRHTQDTALEWMRKKVPALGNKTPRKCLGANLNQLKDVLLSFPC